MERLTVRVKEGNRKDECFIPGNKNAIEKVEYICEGERWESEEYKGKAVDKLAEYEDLEEQNRLLKLPCAVGDTVYTACSWGIESGIVGSIEIISDRIFVNNTRGQMIGEARNIFLTREEAEAALKELERGKGE